MFTTWRAERKLYLGGRLRRLRRELGLNQSAMAGEIGVSPSYLNHLERNQRPVTAQVLLQLAEVYDVDLRSFAAEGGEGTGVDQLAEIFADPMFADIGIPRYELLEVGRQRAVGRRRGLAALRGPGRAAAASGRRRRPTRPSLVTPEAWVRDHIQAQRNHFPYIEEAAETLAGALGDPAAMFEALRRRLQRGVRDRDAGGAARAARCRLSQHYDLHRKRLMLSALLRPESRTFGAAYQLALVEFGPMLKRMVETAGAARRADPPPAPHEPRQLCRRRDHDALCAPSSPRPRSIATTSTGSAPISAPASSRSRTASPPSAAPARAASPSSC